MIKKPAAAFFLSFALAANGFAVAAGNSSGAGFIGDNDSEWQEAPVPAPPAFDVKKLILVEVSPNSSLVYGVDPAAIEISGVDGVVRYVLVATSASGASNVMYEGIRCATGEVKTYGLYTADRRWNMLTKPEWRSMFTVPSKHALRLAKAGACDGATTVSAVDDLVRKLKNPSARVGN